ncbi:MAG: hypothetical protein RIS76_2590 [Verrucomicrobiota bacterium]
MKSFPIFLLSWLAALWGLEPQVFAQANPVDPFPPRITLVITAPADGAEIKDPDAVELMAVAMDPHGILDVVEFTANGELIGTSRIDFCPPCPNPPICPLGPCILPPIGVTLTHRVVWERPLAGKYTVEARARRGDGVVVSSSPVHVAVLRAQQAHLTLNSPTEGTDWSTPGVVPIEVTAVDPDGEIRRVEFFANDRSIGISEILTRDVEIPGRPRTHALNWTNPPVGTQALQARAASRAGQGVVTAVRTIRVVHDLATPIVWVESVDSQVQERTGEPGQAPATLLFRIHREGALSRDLQVFLHTEGEAIVGVDFQPPPFSISLPAGQSSVDLPLRPLDDSLSEGDEGVVCQLDPSPTMGPLEPYRVDPHRSQAKGLIVDDEPLFRFQAPDEGQVFAPGEAIPLRVLTTSATDFVSHLEFLSNGKKIGDSVVNFIQPPPPGTPVDHEFLWTTASIGIHRLTVRTILAEGTVVESADARVIQVSSGPDVPEVSLTVVDGEFTEGKAANADMAEVILRRSGDNVLPLTVFLQWQGTATAGVDFGPAPTEVQIPVGQDEVHLYLAGFADNLKEGDETVELFIIHPPTLPGVLLYRTVSGAGQVRLLLHDGPGIFPIPVVTVETSRPYALEGDRFNRGEFVVHRTGDLSHPLTVNFGMSGEAIRGVDYHLVLNPCDDCAAPDQEVTADHVTIPGGQSSVTLAVVAAFDGLLTVVEPVLESVYLQVYTPPIPAVVGAKPPYLAGPPDRAKVEVVDRRNPNEAEIILIAPVAGDVLPLGVPNGIQAIAVDPRASIRRVEFLANGQLIAVSEIMTDDVDIPGRLRVHTVFWTVTDAAQAGPYELAAQAQEAQGTEIRSSPVPVRVGGGTPSLPVVTLTRGKSPAYEQGDLKSRTGSFVLTRTGGDSLLLPLTVFVEVSGTATRDVDYRWHPEVIVHGNEQIMDLPLFGLFLPVTFAPGATETPFSFAANADTLAEGEETVRLRLIEPPFLAIGFTDLPILPIHYVIGVPREAEVIIEDANFDLPFIVLSEPTSGAQFPFGGVIPLAATAARPDAGVESIQFVADGKVIGTVNYCCDVCDCPAAPPGRAFSARFEWNNASLGTHVLTARTVVGPNLMLESDPVIIIVSETTSGSLVIVTPPEGAVFPVGQRITIDTIGQEPQSLVSTVEFFANGEKIGENCFLCVVDGIFPPGTPLHNQIEWTPAVAGTYALTAVGQFGPNRRIESAPVKIRVTEQPGGPRLSIRSPANGAQVPANQDLAVVAVGVGRVGGITDVALLVDGQIADESRLVFIRPPDVDEEVRHEFSIRLKAGPHELVVVDLLDPSVVSPPVTVLAGTSGAEIAWITPPEGAEFPLGTPILLEVQAVDPTGLLWVVEFFDGEVPIGKSEFSCLTCRLAPGAVIPHQLVWNNAGVGPHLLSVRAVREDGTVVTSPLRSITVLPDPNPGSFVTRDLPDRYEANRPFTVHLVARPEAEVAAYVVEEQPPFALPAPGIPGFPGPFWTVISISHDGVFDPITGKVKFGPFFDHQPRTLTYEVVPNLVVELAWFDGVGVADGKSSPISGERELRGSSRHPADREPADDTINAGELTSYAAAWRRGQPWPDGPNPIPMDFVTRAAGLWKGGERYWYDPSAGLPPFCWVNGNDPIPNQSRAASAAALAGVALRDVVPQADGTLRVTLRVTAAPGTRAFAIEEHLPASAAVSEITAGGVALAGNPSVRWGPFFAGDALVVSYVLSGVTADSGWTGHASFDGQSIPVRDAATGPEAPADRLVGVDRLHDGSHQVCLQTGLQQPGAEYELQVSSDLRQWSTVGTFSTGEDAGFARDTGAAGTPMRFYRAVRLR